MAVVTIAREAGVFGEEVASRLAGRLGFLLVNKERIAQLKSESGLEDIETEALEESVPKASPPDIEESMRMIPSLLVDLAEESDLVIIGRGGQCIFKDSPGTLHIFLFGSLEFRIENLQDQFHLDRESAITQIQEGDRERQEYISQIHGGDWKNLSLYDCTFRMDRWRVDDVVDLIVDSVNNLALRDVSKSKIIEKLIIEAKPAAPSGEFSPYANESEAEFAGFLRYYEIPFQYEPRTFILEKDGDGKLIEAFTPDFYFPEQDLYIELTTLNQSLVTRKNRKIRKLRLLYPNINIRIFYRRDFNQLLTKFGLTKHK